MEKGTRLIRALKTDIIQTIALLYKIIHIRKHKVHSQTQGTHTDTLLNVVKNRLILSKIKFTKCFFESGFCC